MCFIYIQYMIFISFFIIDTNRIRKKRKIVKNLQDSFAFASHVALVNVIESLIESKGILVSFKIPLQKR
jgi:hypothetical protein